MNLAFDSWQAFFAMGEYAKYVWGSLGVSILLLLGLLMSIMISRRALLKNINNQQNRLRRRHSLSKDKVENHYVTTP
jgi:heme exporter protein D